MNCPSCGSVNRAEDSVCAICGAELHPPMTDTTPRQAVDAPAPVMPPPPPGYTSPTAPTNPPSYAPPPPGYAAAPSAPLYPPGYTAASSAPMYPPGYAAAPSAPLYPPGYTAPPSYAPPPGYAQPGYAPPSTPMYAPLGYAAPPSTPMYAPPSTPMYAPPSGYTQPGYAPPGYAPPGYAPGAAPNPLTAATPILSRLFGDDANPQGVQPTTPVQGLLYRNVSPALAVNRWFTAAAGAIVALLVGLGLTAIAESMWTNTIGGLLGGLSSNSMMSAMGSSASSLLSPPLLLLFAIEQHAPLTLSLSGSSSSLSGSGDASLTLPLTGLFLLPAVALIAGGFISAASDYSHTARFSIMRGALIGPMYGILLGVLSFFSSSTSSAGAFGVSVSITMGTNGFAEALYGLLWGVLFGAIGGWIAYAGWSFLEWGMPLLQRAPTKRVAAALAGGGVSYVTGVLLSVALLAAASGALGVMVSAAVPLSGGFSSLSSLSGSSAATGAHGVALALMEIFVLAPVAAMWLFSLASGASLDTNASAAGSTATSSSIGLFGVTTNGVTTHPTIPAWIFLVMLIPLISWVAGGITAARVAQARTAGDGFIAGALAGVPFAVLFALFASFSGATFDASAAGVTASGGFGPPFFGVLISTLIGGAVVGGVGGAMSITMPWIGALPLWIIAPFRVFQPVVYPLLDLLTGHRGGQRSAARQWFYAAALLAVAAVVILIALDLLGGLLMQALPYMTAIELIAGVTALVIFLPLAYLTGALVTAFMSPPGAGVISAPAPAGFAGPMYAPPPSGGFAPQYAPPPGAGPTPPPYAPPPNTGPSSPWPSQGQ